MIRFLIYYLVFQLVKNRGVSQLTYLKIRLTEIGIKGVNY